MTKTQAIVIAEAIEARIFLIRGHKAILSTHLAALYSVESRALVQAVKRNRERFPADFMFQLSAKEFSNLKSQIVISSWGGARRAAPYAFTEQGVAILSSVLRSKLAVLVNIQIIGTPASARFKTATICSTVNRLLFTTNLPSWGIRSCRKLTLKVDQKCRGRSMTDRRIPAKSTDISIEDHA